MRSFLITPFLLLLAASFGFSQAIEPEHDLPGSRKNEKESSVSGPPLIRLWRTELSGLVGTPAVMGEQIFVTTIEGGRPRCFLRAFALNGENKWKRRISTPQMNNVNSMRIVVGGERIFIVSNEEIQVFNDRGKPMWEKSLQKTRGQGTFQILSRKNHDRFSTSLTQAFYDDSDRIKRYWGYPNSLHVAFRQSIAGQDWTNKVDHMTTKIDYMEVYVDLEGKKSICSLEDSSSSHSHRDKAAPFNEETFSSYRYRNRNQFNARFASMDALCDLGVWIQADGLSITHGHFRWNKQLIKLDTGVWKNPSENFSIATNDCVDGNLVLLSDDRLAAMILKFDEKAFGPGSYKKEVEGTDNYGLLRWCFRHDTPIASVLQYDSLVYLMDKKGRLICLDPETKKECYRTLLMTFGHASAPVASNGNIYVMDRNGHVVIFKSGPKFQLDSKFELNEETVGSPIVVDDVIYISTTQALYAFRIRQETGDKYR